MPPESLVDRLAALAVLESVPRSEIEWLVAHGEERAWPAGTTLYATGAVVDLMVILLSGRAALYMQKGGATRRFVQAGAGRIIGRLPFSRIHLSIGTQIIEEATTACVLHEQYFAPLVHECPGLATALVHHLVDRAREFRAVELNDDRLQALSRLASGFAHELTNPASAAMRSAQTLAGLISEEEQSSRQLASARLSDEQLAVVDAVRRECDRPAPAQSALEAADREDAIADWLARHGLDPQTSASLATSDLTLAALDRLAEALPPAAVAVATQWIASSCAARVASRQIEVATGRIHDLVGAVKGFTFMDRQGVPEEVDVARGLADTLSMLGAKARAKSATVHLETAPDLPRVHGFGSEINQVWEQLVDNAIDAVGPQGNITITASDRGDAILVRIADDGPGIPQDIQARVFDPFFTTKPVGQGSGLGLDIARRIVQLHRGDIDFTTQPGRTIFRVRLPAIDGHQPHRTL